MTAQASEVPELSSPDEAAELYATLGWRVVPIGPGKKYPEGLGRWQDAATDELETIRLWYGGLYRGHGVGIVTGPGSGLWVLDIDIAEGKQGATSLAAMIGEHGQLGATVTAVTGSGGLHLFFTWDDDHPITNGMATQLGAGIDVRGAGGQVVAAPTLHPDTGKAYAWQEGRGPWSLDAAAAPPWLYELMAPPEAPEPPSSAPQHTTEAIQHTTRAVQHTTEHNAGPAASVSASVLEGAHVTRTGDDDSIAEWMRSAYQWHPRRSSARRP